ncbi:hypothetical protein MVEN_00463000 [Mycena venus]|uniref:Uncharacterized protein n=1 Tax=Mycena venus TaxID=2733690 RepID=A0A8H6YVA4_9AGAR|nr:hypothetical protein MVEN_00463000 [Mycena venus]
MASSTVLHDVLPIHVPMLRANGENFTIFSLRLLVAVEAKGYLGHFNGTDTRPVFTTAPTQVEADQVALANVSAMWTHVTDTHTTKGAYAQANLHIKFLPSKRSFGHNALEFLENLTVRREDMAAPERLQRAFPTLRISCFYSVD